MSDELKVVPQSTDMVAVMESHFALFREQADEWMAKAKAIQVTDESQVENIEAAKLALKEGKQLVKGIEGKHKDLKEESLRTGQALDKIKRDMVGLVTPILDVLKESADFADVQAEKRRIALRDERTALMKPFFGNDTEHMQLGDMNENTFNTLLAGAKAAKKEKEEAAAEEARVKAEADRKRAEEDKRIRDENEQLKLKQQKTQDRIRKVTALGLYWAEKNPSDGIGAEPDKEWVPCYTIFLGSRGRFSWVNIEDSDDDFFQDGLLKLTELVSAYNKEVAEEKAKRDKDLQKQEEKLKKERAERKRLQDEADAKQAEEEAAKKKKEAEERKAKRAPDKVKLISVTAQIEAIQFLPVGSDEAKKIVEDAKVLLAKVVTFINTKADGL